jgi:hypothetical protein
MGMIIMLQEIKQNGYFYEWFKNKTNIASVFTILAGINLEVLNILSSQVAGIILFSAPISGKTELYIFWGSFIGFFIEDVPRFVIQVCEVFELTLLSTIILKLKYQLILNTFRFFTES